MPTDRRRGPDLQLADDPRGGDRLNRLLDGASEAYLTVHRDGGRPRTTWASDAVLPLLGLEPYELAEPDGLLLHVHPEDHEALEAVLLAEHDGACRYRWRFGGRLDQPWRSLEVTVLPVHGDGALADARIRSLDDAEVLRDRAKAAQVREEQAARELENLQALRQHVLRSLTHRVRTPLAILRASSETALDPPAPLNEEQTADLFARIHRATSTLQDLLTDLLELPNMERVVDLESPVSLMEDIVADAARVALGERHVLRVDAAEAIKVNRQLTAMRRCMIHLLANVERHTPAGTRAHVMIRSIDGHLEVLVSDDGPGLPEHVLTHLFEPFVTGHEEGSSPDPRLGIGLSVVRHLVEGCGGAVDVDSAPGEGTSVQLSVPLTALQDPATF